MCTAIVYLFIQITRFFKNTSIRNIGKLQDFSVNDNGKAGLQNKMTRDKAVREGA